MKTFLFPMAAALILASVAPVKAQYPLLPSAPMLTGLDKSKSPDERQKYLAAQARASLPRLGEDYEVLAPSSDKYNGWSYPLGVFDQWLAPQIAAGGEPVGAVDTFLSQGGYTRLSKFDLSVQPGKHKVAVFFKVKPDGDPQEATHAAVLQADGTWVCKCGNMALIRVRSLEQLRGPGYGVALAVYVRDAAPVALPVELPRF